MDWKQFEAWMMKQFPFIPDMRKAHNPSWVSDYVQKVVNESLNRYSDPLFPRTLQYDLFETHRNLIVRARLPEDVSPNDVRTSVNRRKVRIEWSKGKKQDIVLEQRIDPTRTRAKYKDGILELHMPKLLEPESFYDIDIRE